MKQKRGAGAVLPTRAAAADAATDVASRAAAMPTSSTPLPDETKAAAADVLECEQWLQATGWRPLLERLTGCDGREFASGVKAFRAALEDYERRARERGRLYGAVGFLAASAAGLAAWGAAAFLL